MDNDRPVTIESSLILAKLVTNLSSSKMRGNLLYNIFKNEHKIKLDRARVYFSGIEADEHEANLLEVPLGEQLTVLERYTITEAKAIIEYSRFILKDNGEKYFLEVKI